MRLFRGQFWVLSYCDPTEVYNYIMRNKIFEIHFITRKQDVFVPPVKGRKQAVGTFSLCHISHTYLLLTCMCCKKVTGPRARTGAWLKCWSLWLTMYIPSSKYQLFSHHMKNTSTPMYWEHLSTINIYWGGCGGGVGGVWPALHDWPDFLDMDAEGPSWPPNK